MTRQFFASVITFALLLAASTSSYALVCPQDCASTCNPMPPEPAAVSCQWDAGGCMSVNCEEYLIGLCPADSCNSVCGGVAACNTPCRDKSYFDCQQLTTCGQARGSVPSCDAQDGWIDVGGLYACCNAGAACGECQDQDEVDYECNPSDICQPSIQGTQTLKNSCAVCTDGNSCTNDACNLGACDFSSFAPDTTPCTDNDVCSLNDECLAGVCSPDSVINCNDVNVCTDDSCDPTLGCQNVDNGMCVCAPGDIQKFWTGLPADRNVGACDDGEETCDMVGMWAVTIPEILPSPERPDVILEADSNLYCDADDNDCDGTADFTGWCYPIPFGPVFFQSDPSGSGLNKINESICEVGQWSCTAATDTSCIGAVMPQPEVCDGLDNDCDGVVDNGQPEICDGIDNDCDGQIDEAPASAACGGTQTCHSGTCFENCADTSDCMGAEVCWINDKRCDDPNDPCSSITCPNASDTCYQGTCFVTCTSDAQCDPANEACFDGNVCLNDTDPCQDVQCPDFEVCYQGSCFDPCSGTNPCTAPMVCWDGRCAEDPCDDVLCPLGEDCFGGTCFEICDFDSECDPGSYCYNGRCATDNCENMQCPLGDVCHGGSCFTACSVNGDCPDVCIEAITEPDFCTTGDPCNGVTCGTGQTCFGGTCFDTCLDSITCDPNELCFDARCVDEEVPYCDGVLCPEDQVCVSGSCFDTCTTADGCDPDSYCYQGACVEDECAGVQCVTGSVCHRGVCFVECDPTNLCEAPDGCFDGRCAASECEAMAVDDLVAYNTNHPFRQAGHKLVASQRSTPWIYPRPFQDAGGADFDTWIGYVGNSFTAPIKQARRARVTFYLDSNEGSPGKYVLIASHGDTIGQGPAEAIWNMRFDDVNPDVLHVDDPGAEGYKVTDSDPRHIMAAIKTGSNETGGIAIGFLPADEEWSVKIHASFHGAIDGWDLVNGENGDVYELKNGEPLYLNTYSMPATEQFSPEIGRPCRRDSEEGICQAGTYLECKLFESVCYQTVPAWSVEVCDGLDNTCNGATDNADASLEFPMAYWKQGGHSGYQVLATYDDDAPVSNIINYTPTLADDRLGYPNVVMPDGDAIQTDVDQTHLVAYRDMGTGVIYYGWVFGKDSSAAVYDGAQDGDEDDGGGTYTEREIDMDLDAPVAGDLYSIYVAWYDDRMPASTDDQVLTEFHKDKEEIDFRPFLPIRDGRTDSDAVFFGNDWAGQDLGIDAHFQDVSSKHVHGWKYMLQRPTVGPKELDFYKKDKARIHLRILGKKAEDTICESSTTTPSGCQLSRYACVAGETICQLAVDPACSTCFDLDGDGYFGIDPTACAAGNDCDDENPNVNPGSEEYCNGLDDNCDGLIDQSNVGCPGTAPCGPDECGFVSSCMCPDGAEIPEEPTNECFCGEGLSE